MVKCKTTAIQADLGIFRHIQTYLAIIRYIQAYSGIIQNPGLFRSLGYSEPEVYSKPCQTSTMERHEKQVTAIIIFASYNYNSRYQLFMSSSS